ncbi:MAG: hypothetical protein HQ559_05690, partial [Lentisphaerae bacterium]|nr:hypothetical protein [Lentisphaerota bacterium]
MTVDISLVKHSLAVLATMPGRSLPETTLAGEIENLVCRPLTVDQVRDVLSFCREEGWVDRRRDDYKRDVWCITE